MDKPLDVTLLLAQTLVFVDEGDQAWRRIRDRGEAIVVEPTDADELQAKFAAAHSTLEAVERIVALREEIARGQWRAMVGGFGILVSGLTAIAASFPVDDGRHDGLMRLADVVLDLGRAAAMAAMGLDAPVEPPPPPAGGAGNGRRGPRWTPEVLQGGAA